MTRVDEFDSFYASSSAATLQATYALCGDRQVALDATVDAYQHAWRDWSKIRDHRPAGWVRTEAWKRTVLSRSTHPLRRRHEEDSDGVLLSALHELPVDDRRLIVLLTLGQSDLDEASREVGIPADEGIELVNDSLGRLERALGQPLEEIEERMFGLGRVTRSMVLPPVGAIRRRGVAGRKRNTAVLVAAAVAVTLGAGLASTDGDALANAGLPYREKIGAERPDVVLLARKIGADDLLTAAQVNRLDPSSTWKVVGTDEDVAATTPYATCPTQRFSDPDPLRVFVRTFESDSGRHERVAQAIEVSSSAEVAEEAFRRLVSWYAECEHPRVQLVAAYTVERPFGDFTILQLTSHRSPERTFTVGFSHSGTVTSTLVHEVDGAKGVDVDSFARTLNDSVAKVCAESGGRCTDELEVVLAAPPRTAMAPEFLGIVDLPPIAQVDRVWAAVDPFVAAKGENPAVTVCDRADFARSDVTAQHSRIFVIPEASELPKEFGITETVAQFASEKAAKAYVKKLQGRVASCEDDNLSASVGKRRAIATPVFTGSAWKISFEVSKKTTVTYRMALVRRGANVAQVLFAPAPGFDISAAEFTELAARAGQRLKHLEN